MRAMGTERERERGRERGREPERNREKEREIRMGRNCKGKIWAMARNLILSQRLRTAENKDSVWRGPLRSISHAEFHIYFFNLGLRFELLFYLLAGADPENIVLTTF